MTRGHALVVTFVLGLACNGFAQRNATASAVRTNKIYDQNCSVCHQAGGVGIAGSFPRLSQRVTRMAAVPVGRRLVMAAVLFGMAGRLQVDGQSIIGVMPAFVQLSDAHIADLLNYLAALGGQPFKKFAAQEIARIRAQPALTPVDVNALARDPALATEP